MILPQVHLRKPCYDFYLRYWEGNNLSFETVDQYKTRLGPLFLPLRETCLELSGPPQCHRPVLSLSACTRPVRRGSICVTPGYYYHHTLIILISGIPAEGRLAASIMSSYLVTWGWCTMWYTSVSSLLFIPGHPT